MQAKIAATATSPTALTLGYTWNANGNLQEETIGPNSSCTIPQYFYYDHVNRVQMSVESPTTVPAQTATACPTPTSSFTWCEQFAYDQFGNRTPTTFNLGATPLAPTAFNAATNRISSTGWAYDAGAGSGNGNITTDPSNAKMTLDGENRMVSYTPGSGAAVQYTYDGDGRRVTKDATSGAPTTYVYDAAGQLTAAYSSVANPVTGTEFLTADHLGSIRMITNSTGNAVARHDTEPFGEELLGGSTGCRLSSLGYGATSGVTLEFTGKERDAESGLDYFGARYYGSSMGRFMSPDPIKITEDRLVNPANTLNLYSYAANNPLKYVDPDGQDVTYFYDQGGVAGHAVLFAYNPTNGQSAIESFGPAVHSPIWAGESQFEMSSITSADDLRSKFSSLTIQTSPELAQQVIDYIKANPDPSTWTALGPNCSTQVWKILQKFKLANQHKLDDPGLRPKLLWNALKQQYNPQAPSTPKNGTDYGHPRMDMFNLMWLSLPQAQPTHEKVTVTIKTTDGQVIQ